MRSVISCHIGLALVLGLPQCCNSIRPNLIQTELEKPALDRGRTDRISLTHDVDLDLQSPASYGYHLLACKSSRSTVSLFRRYSGKKQTDGGDCITSHANAVGNQWTTHNTRSYHPHFDVDRQSLAMVMTHTHAKGQRQRSLHSNDSGKGQTDGADCITLIANVVGKYRNTFIVKSTYLVFS